jgi:hypothetical protein
MKRQLRLAAVLLAALLAAPLAQAGIGPVTGNTPWLVLLCKFSGQGVEPYTAKDIEPFFSEAGMGTGAMFDYWSDMSFGNVDLTGSRAFGWFEVDLSLEEYKDRIEDGNEGRSKSHRDCVHSAKGVSLNGFYGTIVIWNSNDPSVQAWGYGREVNLPPGTPFSMSLEPTPAAWAMGRALGLQFPTVSGGTVSRSDPWELMSCPFCLTFTNPASGRGMSGPGLSGANRSRLGWIDAKRTVEAVPGKRVTATLESLSDGSGSGPLLAHARLASGEDWYADLRMPAEWDAAFTIPLLHLRRMGADDVPKYVLSTSGSRLSAGRRAIDTASDLQLRVVAVGAGTADIEMGPIGPIAIGEQIPPRPVTVWNTTDVEVAIGSGTVAPRYSLPIITYEVTGAQVEPPKSVTALDVSVIVKADGETFVHFSAADSDGNVGDAGQVQVFIDRTPPVSTATAAPRAGGGFTATITATDPGVPPPSDRSGVKEIHFLLNGFGPETVVAGNTASVTLPSNGWTTLVYWAVDRAGNEEYPYKTLTIAPHLDITPVRLDLVAPVNGYGPAGLVTLRNSGAGTITITGVTSDSYFFRAVPGATCVGPLPGGSTCVMQVDFYAPAAGDIAATLFIQTDDFHQVFRTVELHGHGVVANILFMPNPMVFGNTYVGQTSFTSTLRIINDSPVPLTMTDVSTGTNAFPIVTDHCGPRPFTLAAHAICEVVLAFVPQSFGPHSAALTVQSSLGTRSVSVQGFGLVPVQLRAVPNSVDFGIVSVGGSKRARVRLYNDGTSPFMIARFSILGAPMYSIIGAQCTNGTAPTSIEPGQVCVIDVTYAPTSPGSQFVQLRVESSIGQPAFVVPMGGQTP